jgi:hypothetical protein
MVTAIRNLTPTTIGLATAELILNLQREFPGVRIEPCEPVEGEDIHLRAYLPIQPAERLSAQNQIVEIEWAVQDKYGVQTIIVAIPN